jgi:hypothetical protein
MVHFFGYVATCRGYLIRFRALAGFVMIVNAHDGVAGVLSDEHRALAFLFFSIGPLNGPMYGPIIGGFTEPIPRLEMVGSNPFRCIVDPHSISEGDVRTANTLAKGKENKRRNQRQQMVVPL